MAVTATPIFPQLIHSDVAQILPADTTTLKTLYTAGADGSLISMIRVSSTDTANKDLAFYVTIGGTDYLLGTVQIPANSGNTNLIPAVDILSHAVFNNVYQDVNGNKCFFLESGAVLKVKVTATLTAAKAIQFFLNAGNY